MVESCHFTLSCSTCTGLASDLLLSLAHMLLLTLLIKYEMLAQLFFQRPHFIYFRHSVGI